MNQNFNAVKKLLTIVALVLTVQITCAQVHLYKKGTHYQTGDFKGMSDGWIMLYQTDQDKLTSNAFKLNKIDRIVVADSANYKAIVDAGFDTSIFTFNITRSFNPNAATHGRSKHANATFFAVSRPQLDNVKPGSYKIMVASSLAPAAAYDAVINHLFNHQLASDKTEPSKFIATSTIEPPNNIGYIRYEVFIKPTATGCDIAIVPFTKISPEINRLTFGTGVTEWEKMTGWRGMYESVYGYAWRGAISIAQQLNGQITFTQ